jgi:hypothetical protein
VNCLSNEAFVIKKRPDPRPPAEVKNGSRGTWRGGKGVQEQVNTLLQFPSGQRHLFASGACVCLQARPLGHSGEKNPRLPPSVLDSKGANKRLSRAISRSEVEVEVKVRCPPAQELSSRPGRVWCLGARAEDDDERLDLTPKGE